MKAVRARLSAAIIVGFLAAVVGLLVAISLSEPMYCPAPVIADRCGMLLFEPELINWPGVDAVAVARIVEVLPTRWTTLDGKLPQGGRPFEDGLFLYTPVVLDVLEFWEGAQETHRLVVLSSGGSDRKSGCTDEACGRLKHASVGDRVVVLLEWNEVTEDLGEVWEEVWVLNIEGDIACLA